MYKIGIGFLYYNSSQLAILHFSLLKMQPI